MFNLRNNLRLFFVSFAMLVCIGLAAQDFKIAVLEPIGNEEAQFSLVRNSLTQVVVNTPGYQAFDRQRTDQIMEEHKRVQTDFLFGPDQARSLGKMMGVDFICSPEVNRNPDDNSLIISVQVLDIVKGQIIASRTSVLEGNVTTARIQGGCTDLMKELLKGIKVLPPGDDLKSVMLDGIDGELSKAVLANRTNAKWNRNRTNYSVEVDLGSVNIQESRDHGTPLYRIGGSITFILTDNATGGSSATELPLDQFTEMTKDRIRKGIKDQVQRKIGNFIIKELLENLED
jgi:hypothetical protein